VAVSSQAYAKKETSWPKPTVSFFGVSVAVGAEILAQQKAPAEVLPSQCLLRGNRL
jgi:hypothetical protein